MQVFFTKFVYGKIDLAYYNSMDYVAELEKDIRFEEALHSCLNCGVCCAICPAAEFYNYDPRMIVTTVQRRNNEEIEQLLKSNTIWYCGQCKHIY